MHATCSTFPICFFDPCTPHAPTLLVHHNLRPCMGVRWLLPRARGSHALTRTNVNTDSGVLRGCHGELLGALVHASIFPTNMLCTCIRRPYKCVVCMHPSSLHTRCVHGSAYLTNVLCACIRGRNKTLYTGTRHVCRVSRGVHWTPLRWYVSLRLVSHLSSLSTPSGFYHMHLLYTSGA